jgi:hypothetical protein
MSFSLDVDGFDTTVMGVGRRGAERTGMIGGDGCTLHFSGFLLPFMLTSPLVSSIYNNTAPYNICQVKSRIKVKGAFGAPLLIFTSIYPLAVCWL